jgi:hypothetical protein
LGRSTSTLLEPSKVCQDSPERHLLPIAFTVRCYLLAVTCFVVFRSATRAKLL